MDVWLLWNSNVFYLYWLKGVANTMSLGMVGWIIGGMYLVGAISMILVGRSSDRMQERKYHVACCLLVSAIGLILSVYFSKASIGLALATYTVSLGRCLWGIFSILGYSTSLFKWNSSCCWNRTNQ